MSSICSAARRNQLAPAAEDARGLRSANRLAAAEGHQVGAGGDDRSQVGPRRQLGGRVDQHRQVMGMRPADDIAQRRSEPAASTYSTPAVRGPNAASYSQASARRTPAPDTISWKPTSTSRAPAARTAWS